MVEIKQVGNKLVVTAEVDISDSAKANAPISSSGKSKLLLTTTEKLRGSDIKVGLNIYMPNAV